MTEISAGAAPQVKKMFSPRMEVWKRAFRSSAMALRAGIAPGAGV